MASADFAQHRDAGLALQQLTIPDFGDIAVLAACHSRHCLQAADRRQYHGSIICGCTLIPLVPLYVGNIEMNSSISALAIWSNTIGKRSARSDWVNYRTYRRELHYYERQL